MLGKHSKSDNFALLDLYGVCKAVVEIVLKKEQHTYNTNLTN